MTHDHEIQLEAKLTQGAVGPLMVRLSLPLIWGLFAVVSFNLADTYFVAQISTTHLAAMSFTFPVVMVLGSVALGLGTGASSVIARTIGEGNRSQVKRLTTDSLVLALLIVGLFVIVGLFTIDPLFRALGAKADTLPMIREYMEIWYLGILFLVVPMVGNHAIRASGNTLFPGLIMTVSAGVNIVLDPLLIFGHLGFPRMELRGAAIATVFARMITFVASLAVLHYREKMLSYTLPKMKEVLTSWKQVLHVGLPAAGTNLIGPLSFGITTTIIASFGEAAVAGFGVATRIEAFAMIVLIAVAASFGPFVGQNWAAGRSDRVREGLKLGIWFSLGWGLLAAISLGLFAVPLARLFNSDPEVIASASSYLRIVPICYAGLGTIMITAIQFNARGKPLPAVWLALLRLIIIYIPLALLGKALFGPPGVYGATSIATIAVGLLAAALLRKI